MSQNAKIEKDEREREGEKFAQAQGKDQVTNTQEELISKVFMSQPCITASSVL